MKGQGGLRVVGLQLVVAALGMLAAVLMLASWTSPPGPTDPTASCDLECVETYMAGIKKMKGSDFVLLLRDKYLFPPPPSPNTSLLHTERMPWRELLEWDKLQVTLENLWKDQAPGVFVEVGAADGEFMSQTLVLERNLSWTGLLVEPDPRSFAVLQQRRRNAWTSPICIRSGMPSSKQFWMHYLLGDLPPELQGLVMARSKLVGETVFGDNKRGTTIRVPCLPLSLLLEAAKLTSVDMLSVATGVPGDETRIADVTRNKKLFHVKTLLVQYPRSYLRDHPYPIISGYIIDLERSHLLLRLYWRRSGCRLVQEESCHRAQTYDLVMACRKFLCYGFAEVWTYKL
ncbi:uncharacterized protein LOC127004589 [Eriocheir sinensis]|uniref:uncharacterized protein LOC127004589 n=1 Tax=Eriocheir sinensis TaxID=95602 RepID=UPI0021C76B21|nr:uncharacterized protein LOC127004589 [Eriocheir sinensis]